MSQKSAITEDNYTGNKLHIYKARSVFLGTYTKRKMANIKTQSDTSSRDSRDNILCLFISFNHSEKLKRC